MNEIEKMYKLAGFEKSMGVGSPLALYPFTAEKQLKLLVFLLKLDLYGEVILGNLGDEYLIKVEIIDPGFTLVKVYRNTLEEAIAAVINSRWEHFNEKQKEEIKEILND